MANLIFNGEQYITSNYLRNFTQAEAHNIVIEEDGTIWIGTISDLDGGVYKTHVDIFRDSSIKFERYYTDEGLPEGATYMFIKDKEIYAGTDKGLFKHVDGKFALYNEFGVDFSTERCTSNKRRFRREYLDGFI